MKKGFVKTKSAGKTVWADEIRKHKPKMNALSDGERHNLLAEGLAIIYGAGKAKVHARSR